MVQSEGCWDLRRQHGQQGPSGSKLRMIHSSEMVKFHVGPEITIHHRYNLPMTLVKWESRPGGLGIPQHSVILESRRLGWHGQGWWETHRIQHTSGHGGCSKQCLASRGTSFLVLRMVSPQGLARYRNPWSNEANPSLRNRSGST